MKQILVSGRGPMAGSGAAKGMEPGGAMGSASAPAGPGGSAGPLQVPLAEVADVRVVEAPSASNSWNQIVVQNGKRAVSVLVIVGLLIFTGTVTNTGNTLLTNVVVVNDHPASNTVVFGPVTLPPPPWANRLKMALAMGAMLSAMTSFL